MASRVPSQVDTIKVDTRGCMRHQRSGKKVVLLIALGFWTDGSGKREILDWQVADGESKAAWDPFVHRLWERGVRPENGLQAVIRDGCGELGEAVAWVYGTTVVEQRCIFHKMRHVADKCREELKGEEKKEERKQLMTQVSAIYQAERAAEATARLGTFAQAWQARVPKTVATLQRDARADHCLLHAGRGDTRTRPHHFALGADQSRVTAQVSPSLLLWQSKGG